MSVAGADFADRYMRVSMWTIEWWDKETRGVGAAVASVPVAVVVVSFGAPELLLGIAVAGLRWVGRKAAARCCRGY